MDLISRQDVMELMDWYDHNYGEIESYLDTIREDIKSLPSAQKTGKWILCDNQRQEDIKNGNYMFFCSNCLKADLHAKTQDVPYCWWCGASMRGEKE